MAGPNQSRTKKQIRQQIGIDLKAIDLDAGTAERSPSEASSTAEGNAFIYDESLAFGSVNEYRGKWIIATDTAATPLTEIRRIGASSPDARTFQMSVPFTNTPGTGMVYEIWDEEVSPISIHAYMDEAIMEVSRNGAQRMVSDSMHYSTRLKEYPLASSFTGVTDVEYRTTWTGEQLVSYDSAPSTLSANTHITLDTTNYLEGAGAARIDISSSESAATDIAGSTFGSADLSFYDSLELWVNTTVATADTAQLTLKLLNGSSVRETLVLPALGADSFTHVTLTLANPELDTDITGVRLTTGSSGAVAKVVTLDDLRAFRSDSPTFTKLHRKFWSLNQSNRSLVIRKDAPITYNKMRVSGVKLPTLLTNDTTASDIDAVYITNSAVGKHLRAIASRSGENIDASFEQSIRYESLAQAQRLRIHAPANVRWLDG
tara:strand:+ start:4473 stop:5768 length:1296 start_codon:yes stop_codon:yes gene_type:complete